MQLTFGIVALSASVALAPPLAKPDPGNKESADLLRLSRRPHRDRNICMAGVKVESVPRPALIEVQLRTTLTRVTASSQVIAERVYVPYTEKKGGFA